MRQKNTPNYSAYVMGMLPGRGFVEVEFTIEQVCRPGRAAVEAMNNRIVEHVEGLKSVTGLDYRVCLPGDYGAPCWYNEPRRVDIWG